MPDRVPSPHSPLAPQSDRPATFPSRAPPTCPPPSPPRPLAPAPHESASPATAHSAPSAHCSARPDSLRGPQRWLFLVPARLAPSSLRAPQTRRRILLPAHTRSQTCQTSCSGRLVTACLPSQNSETQQPCKAHSRQNTALPTRLRSKRSSLHR